MFFTDVQPSVAKQPLSYCSFFYMCRFLNRIHQGYACMLYRYIYVYIANFFCKCM